MVKKLEKYKNHNLAIAIQMNFKAGMKAKAIAELFKISKQMVNYWLHNSTKKELEEQSLQEKRLTK